MTVPCSGSLDKSLPRSIIWKILPHRLLFGRSYTRTWGKGGVAFLNPERDTSEKAHLCMYRITYVICLVLALLILVVNIPLMFFFFSAILI